MITKKNKDTSQDFTGIFTDALSRTEAGEAVDFHLAHSPSVRFTMFPHEQRPVTAADTIYTDEPLEVTSTRLLGFNMRAEAVTVVDKASNKPLATIIPSTYLNQRPK